MPTKAPITLKTEITELLASGNFGSEYRQPKFLEWRLTCLAGAGPDTPWYMVLGSHDAPAPAEVAKHC
jgi:hypothetical protein